MNRLRKMVEIPNLFTAYDPDLIRFFNDKCVKLPNINSLGGQALAWMSQPYMRGGESYITRTECEDFCSRNGIKTGDAIQAFNKPAGSMPGLKLTKTTRRGQYSLRYPFEFNDMEKRLNVDSHVLENGSRDDQIAYVKNYHLEKIKENLKDCEMFFELLKYKYSEDVEERFNRELSHIRWTFENIIEMPNEKWHIGHLDATKGNDPSNLFYQPPIQARYRDNCIFNREFERIKVKV